MGERKERPDDGIRHPHCHDVRRERRLSAWIDGILRKTKAGGGGGGVCLGGMEGREKPKRPDQQKTRRRAYSHQKRKPPAGAEGLSKQS